MTLIFKSIGLVLVLCAVFNAGAALAQDMGGVQPLLQSSPSRSVVGVAVNGLNRTDKAWLLSYIDLSFPSLMTEEDTVFLERKLLTTGAFTEVTATLTEDKGENNSYILVINVVEKWTLIPVLRGAYGGGTPLLVLGGYDIHTAGRLWTFGAEARKYGDAEPGYVVYFKDPRRQGDRYYLGAEFWQMYRQRDLFDVDGSLVNSVATNTTRGRVNLLAPFPVKLPVGNRFAWKYGVDLGVMREAVEDERHLRILPTLVHDNVDIDNTQMDGFRLIVRAGPSFETHKVHSVIESDAFFYWLATKELNLAAHWFFAMTTSPAFETLYFLGGFDSVRGFPDGVVYGSRASYVNLEARLLTARWRYIWLESAVFYDDGFAGDEFETAWQNRRSAAGIGLRFAVPQVHRLMLRFDYAWAVDGSEARGLSAGINHLFQPYRPL